MSKSRLVRQPTSGFSPPTSRNTTPVSQSRLPRKGRRSCRSWGQPQDAVSRMGVGPPHTIEEVTEGDEVMEKRGRQDGITTEQAKGRTQRWQPLLPNLQRVNEAARSSGQTRFTALLHHVDVAALERAFWRQRRAASPGMDRVTVDGTVNLIGSGRDKAHEGRSHERLCPSGHAGDLSPGLEGLGSGGSILGGGAVIAAEVEQVVDLVVSGEEALSLAG